jgi:hypothetical protein
MPPLHYLQGANARLVAHLSNPSSAGDPPTHLWLELLDVIKRLLFYPGAEPWRRAMALLRWAVILVIVYRIPLPTELPRPHWFG